MKNKIAMIGGSLREQIVCDSLKAKGYRVASYAMDKDDAADALTIEQCFEHASALILPVRSNHKEMLIEGSSKKCPIRITKELLALLEKNAVIYCGAASVNLRSLAMETDHPLKEIMEYDSVAIPNAVLTAEGTLRYIMEHTDISLKNLVITLFGFGRVGKACAEVFTGAGCRVIVFCRKEEDIRKGREYGYDMRYYSGVSSVLHKTDFLVNTVPSLLVDEKMISQMRSDNKIIDLASVPGGVDFAAAERYGISAVLLPGIPGKYAPVSAGKILATFYEDELKPLLGGDLR